MDSGKHEYNSVIPQSDIVWFLPEEDFLMSFKLYFCIVRSKKKKKEYVIITLRKYIQTRSQKEILNLDTKFDPDAFRYPKIMR